MPHLSPPQFADWVRYAEAEPFGSPWEDAQFGSVRRMMAVGMGSKDVGPLADYLLRPPDERPTDEMTPEETRRAFSAALGIKPVRASPED